MKCKLVLVGEAWRIDKQFRALAVYLCQYNTPFTRATDKICADCIPDLNNWGPGEAYFQEPDYARPIGAHNLGKSGIAICFSQLYAAEDRLLNELTRKEFALVFSVLKEFKLHPMEVQVFAETHVSDSKGRSYFIELAPKWI